MIKGIDVAKWQGNIDWKKVKKDGVQFAILKIINKSRKVEESFEKNYKGANDNGIPVGVYNYSYATSVEAARADANMVVKILNGRKCPCKVWLDVEDNCQKNMGVKLAEIINAYKGIIVSAGYDFGVYTGLSFYNSYIKPYAKYVDCDFWVARYPSTKEMKLAQDPSSTKKPSIKHNLWGWQYSSSGVVSGISGRVDLDVCYAKVTTGKVVSTTIYFPKYTGSSTSIVAALNSLGINSSLSYRNQIGKANGISGVGTSKANTEMLSKLKKGTLERP